MMLFACAALAIRSIQASTVDLVVSGRRFELGHAQLKAGDSLRLVNRDNVEYTVESPGAFPGDVMLAPHSTVLVSMRRSGDFVAMLEEQPDSEVRLSVAESPNFSEPREIPFDGAKAKGRQPLDYADGIEPSYGSITTFNLKVKGQVARQKALRELYALQEELSMDRPPAELAAYFTASQWSSLRPTVSMVTALGPSAFDVKRFGQAVASSRPSGLHPVPGPVALGLLKGKHGQRDILIRVTSNSSWFNQRVCRLIWRRLGSRIANFRLESGYSNPNGRSPILGGFYDGTGNPSGLSRSRAIFRPDGTAMLALYRIRFDEDAFMAYSAKQRQNLVGRELGSGRPLKNPDVLAHKVRAADGHSAIVRMPLIFDEGVTSDGTSETGLLFLSAQASFEPLENLLSRMTAGSEGKRDRLLELMHFEEAGYYVVLPSAKGSFPGSLRKSAFTFGS
jgi:deferrochelatase/peroxidase EfeB